MGSVALKTKFHSRVLRLSKRDDGMRLSSEVVQLNLSMGLMGYESNTNSMDLPLIAVIGGGFAGLNFVKHIDLRKYRVAVIDENNYHSFPPLFYQVASAGLDPSSICFPLRRELRKLRSSNVSFHLGRVESVDFARRNIHTDSETIRYDMLVIAAGTINNFFGMPQLQDSVYTIKSTAEALRCRNDILRLMERAAIEKDGARQKAMLQFVVIGGGPAGVEIAGALGEMKRYVLPREYPSIPSENMSVTLLEGTDRLLGTMSSMAQQTAIRDLNQLMVNVRLKCLMKDFADGVVTLADGERIPASHVIWTAGVTASAFRLDGMEPEFNPRGHGARFVIDRYCRVKGLENVYAIGDISIIEGDADYPNGHPQLAQVAIQQGRLLASNLNVPANARPFSYNDKGAMATIGRNRAVVDMKNSHLTGFPAWLTWMFVHLISLLGMRNKLTVLINWIWAYFNYSTSLRLLIRPARHPFKNKSLYAALIASLIPIMGFADNTDRDKYLEIDLPDHWRYVSEQTIEAPDNLTGWWRVFGDSTLDSLVARGLETNLTVAEAYHRSLASKAAIGSARAAFYPEIGLIAGYTHARTSGRTTSMSMNPVTESYFNAGLNASWELDIFGRIAKGVKAKKSAYMASKAEWAGAMVSITAQIASQYIQLRAFQARMAVAKAHLESQHKVVAIAEARYEATLASKLDVAQARETYYATAATIPQLQNSINRCINALSVLVGIDHPSVSAMVSADSSAIVLPNPDRLIGIGVPADLLRRRPDIAQAEMEVASLAAQVGVAKSDFLPTLTINGTIGTQAHSISDLFSHDSFAYSIVPTLNWTVFDGFSRKYALSQTREQLKAAVDNYNLTVLSAIEEADNAISTYVESLIYKDALRKVIEANDEALRLAVDRYKNSLSPMSDVVTAQINALQAESNLIAADGSALSALVSLYEALGGGFDINSFSIGR